MSADAGSVTKAGVRPAGPGGRNGRWGPGSPSG